MMMKLGPVIWMFSKTRAPDCAISVLIAERTAGLTWPWMSLATVNPFPSAITEPRIPVVFRRNSPRIFPSCPSMPSSEKLERAAFRRDSLRCIPFPPGPVQDRGLLEQHRAAGIRLLHEAEERASRRPDDEKQFVGPIPHAAQPDDQQRGSECRREADGNCGSANEHRQRDEPHRERTEEPLDPLFHDEHSGPPDVLVHAREREKRDRQESRDGPEECEEADDNPEVCHGWSNARLRIACLTPIYLSLRMFSFVTNLRGRFRGSLSVGPDPSGLRLSETSEGRSGYSGLPHLRQKAASSISRLPQFRHLTFTTSFGGAGSTRGVLVAPRVVERACCMYVSRASGDIPAPPPIAPSAPPITTDMNALRSMVPPSPIRVKPNPPTAYGRYQPPGLPRPVMFPLSGGGLMYESSCPSLSAE